MVTQRLRKMSGDVAALPSPACRGPDSARESAPARFMHCYCRVPLPPASRHSLHADEHVVSRKIDHELETIIADLIAGHRDGSDQVEAFQERMRTLLTDMQAVA